MTSDVAGYDSQTALIVVDVQNDFADPSGSLYVKDGEGVVHAANREVARALEAGSRIFYTQDWHPASTPHFQTEGGIWPPHCIQGTWGAELHPRLVLTGDVVRKGSGGEDGYSGFMVRDPVTGETSATGLERQLRASGVEKLVVIGLATDYCVKETAVDGARLGFDVVVLRDAIRAVDLEPGDGDRALEEIRKAGGRVE